MKIKTNRVGEAPGFTLIELLVVISIIALLLAILLPSLRHAHETGNMAVCASQLDQIFNAAFIHSLNTDDRLPFMGRPGIPGNTGEWWVTQVAHAMEQFESEIYLCPSDDQPSSMSVYYNGSVISVNQSTATSRMVRLPVTYRGACDLLEEVIVKGSTIGVYRPRKITSWKYPAVALMLVEGVSLTKAGTTDHSSCFRFQDTLGLLVDPTYNQGNNPSWQRHLGKGNYLFMDGHVDTFLPREAGEMANNQEYYLP
jgi:prepilin-type N-terminal cleavage/methylation domain-containing protein/prepilin-type processing-associated H-X9-DG protein